MTMDILKYNEKEAWINLESVNINSELAVHSRKYQKKRKLEEMVTEEYHEYLDVFEEEEKTVLPPHWPGVDLDIGLGGGHGLSVKKYTHSHRTHCKNSGTISSRTKNEDGYERSMPTEDLLSCSSKRKTESSDYVSTTKHSTMPPRNTGTHYW